MDLYRQLKQDQIVDRLLVSLNSDKPFRVCLSGESGIGKKFTASEFCRKIDGKFNFTMLSKNAGVKSADLLSHQSYSVFWDAFRNENPFWKGLKSFAKESFKNVKCVGTLINFHDTMKKSFMDRFSPSEITIANHLLSLIDKEKIQIIVCLDVDDWDIDSKIFLSKLCCDGCDLFSGVSFLLTSSDPNQIFCKTAICLNKLEYEDFANLVKPSTSKNLSSAEIGSLYKLTRKGNIELTLSAIQILRQEKIGSILKDGNLLQEFNRSILSKTNESEGKRIIELIEKASLLGYSTHKTLLLGYSRLEHEQFLIFMKVLAELEYMSLSENTVKFTDRLIYRSLSEKTKGEAIYTAGYAEFIKRAFPSDYSYIADSFYAANDFSCAALYQSLYNIAYVRNKQFKLEENFDGHTLLTKYGFIETVKNMTDAYLYYYCGKSEDAVSRLNLVERQEPILNFEKIYLRALICCNGDISNDLPKDFLLDLLSFLKSDIFKNQFVEAWLRCALLVLSIYIDLNQSDEADALYASIHNTFIECREKTHDLNLVELQYLFNVTTATFMKKVDIAKNLIFHAYQYYDSQLEETSDFSHYFIALVNYSSCSLITRDYEKTIELYRRSVALADNGISISFDCRICMENNFTICLILQSGYDAQVLSDAATVYEKCIRENTNLISDTLLRLNLYNIYFLSNDRRWKQIQELFDRIDDYTENYYRYYVYTNYAVMLYLTGDNGKAIDIFGKIKGLVPVPKDRIYFQKRNERLSLLIQGTAATDTDIPQWNDMTDVKPLGDAWSFWGKYLLFSELELWSY